MTTSRRGRTSGRSLIQQSRSISPAEKALVHNVTGAGKARIKREFFALDDTDEQALRDELARRVERNLQGRG